jgi:hypothetical protein
MKITETTTRTLIISEVERLDTITVMITQMNESAGKIIIECYGKSWSAFWGAMGNRSIEEFFVSCDNPYLIKNLSNEQSTIIDPDWEWDGNGDYEPKYIENHAYSYLERICDAVKDAFKLNMETAKPATSNPKPLLK